MQVDGGGLTPVGDLAAGYGLGSIKSCIVDMHMNHVVGLSLGQRLRDRVHSIRYLGHGRGQRLRDRLLCVI